MPTTYDTIYDFLGTGSIAPADVFGNASGDYTTTGIDLWTLPGIIMPMPHNGTFKKGPASLFVSGTARNSWWGAKIRDINTPIVDVYSIVSSSASLQYTSSLLPAMPRSFDFEIDGNGQVMIAAEVNQILYVHQSYTSVWQLIVSESFTPKLLYINDACLLVYVNNNYNAQYTKPYALVENIQPAIQWWAELNTALCTSSSVVIIDRSYIGPFAGFSLNGGGPMNSLPLPDSINVPMSPFISGFATNDVYGRFTPAWQQWYWNGSISGTMSGIMTGSIRGIVTGTLNNGLSGPFATSPPGMLYSQLSGDMSGVFGGNFVGSAAVTGNFWGTINGDFSGTYYDISGTAIFPPSLSYYAMTPVTSSGTWTSTGSYWFLGTMSGMLSGAVVPDSQSMVKPICFIDNVVATESNRLQLTYGTYNPISQSAAYVTTTSQINVTAGVVPGLDGGGVPFSLEIMLPSDRITPPVADVAVASVANTINGVLAPHGLDPSTKYTQLTIGVGEESLITGGHGTYEFSYIIGCSGSAGGDPFQLYYHNTGSIFNVVTSVGAGVYGGGQYSPTAVAEIEAGTRASLAKGPLSDYGFALGTFFPSNSLASEIFDGSHRPFSYTGVGFISLVNIDNTHNITFATQSGNDTATPNEGAGFSDTGANRNNFYMGVKARPIFLDASGSFTCSILPIQAGGPFIQSASAVLVQQVINPFEVIPLTLSPFSWAPTKLGGIAQPDVISPTALGPYHPFWYPDVVLQYSFTGSTYHKTYSGILTTYSYLVYGTLSR